MPTVKKIRADQLLAELGLAESREKARRLIMAGRVFLVRDGREEPVDKPGRQLPESMRLAVREGERFGGHVQHIQAASPFGWPQIALRLAVEMEDLAPGIDQHDTGPEVSQEYFLVGLRESSGGWRDRSALGYADGSTGGADRKCARRLAVRADQAVDPPRLGNRLEEVLHLGDAFGLAQEEVPARGQGEAEQREDLLLEGRLDVDQHVAATDQVEL